MILEEIRIKDWRCFYGSSSIDFSEDPEKPVTLIYAENGVGKTTILNAMLWCLFDETTARFEKRDEILNYDAEKAGRTEASVEVFFEHNDQRYVAKRIFRANSRTGDSDIFKVARIEGGSHHQLDSPDSFINSVIPKDMAGHFLFDGESAENFSAEDNSDVVKDAVRDILGCTLIETAIEDLKKVSSSFRQTISSNSPSQEMERLTSEIESLTEQISTAEETLLIAEQDRKSTETQINDIDKKLRETEHAKHFQRERDAIALQLDKARKRKEEYEADILKWLGDNGRFIVSKKISEEAYDFLEKEEHKGKLPAPYNEEFVKDLLSSKKCICGRALAPGSKEVEEVSSLLHQASNKIMIDRVIKVRARINNLKAQRAQAPSRLLEAKKRLAAENQEISVLEAKEGEVGAKIKNINFADIAERELKREELKKKLSNLERHIGAVASNIQSAKNSIVVKEQQIDALAETDKQTKVFIKRKNLCEKLKGILELKLVEEEKDAKTILRGAIKRVIETTSRKTFAVRMSDDYSINLVNKDGTTLPKSSGENQLIGLAFISALVEYAKLRQGAQDKSMLPGTIAPLVLDSPFGQLDPLYKVATAEFIPKMARQVIMLLSQSQGDKEVLKVLTPFIGAEYILIRHNTGERGSRKIEKRAIGKSDVVITEYESSFDGTEIRKVA